MSETAENLENQNLDAELADMSQAFGPDPATVEQQAQAVAEQQQQQGAADQWAGIVGMILKPAADILAPNWRLQDEEIKELSEAYGACAAELWPDVAEAGPWVSAVAVTGMVVVPRLGVPRTLPKPPPEQAPEPAPEKPGEGGGDGG